MRTHAPSLYRQTGAFTLIELLVVIVILGILMAVAVPTFLRQQTKAQDSRTQQYLTTAYKAIRVGTPDTNNQYPSSTSMVSWIQQSEPELTAQRGDCLTGVTNAPVDAVLVDPASTANSLQLCSRSQSGNVWKLTASATGQQQLLDGTLVPLTMSGNEITDASRAANLQGDGLPADSSTGIWEGTTNLVTNGGFETNTAGWAEPNSDLPSSPSTISRDSTDAKFGVACGKLVVNGLGGANLGSYSLGGNAITSSNSQITASAWLKAKSGQSIFIRIVRVLTSGGTQWSTAQDIVTTVAGNGTWQHVSATLPAYTGADTTNQVVVRVGLTTAGLAVGDWIKADGVQVEQKPIATPYVETNGATATRGAAGIGVPTGLISQTNTFWFAERFVIESTDDTVNHYLAYVGVPGGYSIYLSRTQGGPNRVWDMQQSTVGGVGWTDNTNPAGATHTLIGYVTPTTFGVSLDGGAFVTGARSGGTGLTPSALNIGAPVPAASQQLDGRVFWFACGTGTLSNADATTISGWGNSDPKRSSFPAAAEAMMVWNGVGATGSLK